MKSKLLLLLAFFSLTSNLTFSQTQLSVGQKYQCFIEDYANKAYDWINISWEVDNELNVDYTGSYVKTVSFHEYKSGTYKVIAKWSETDMNDPFDIVRHKSHTWYFTCKDDGKIKVSRIELSETSLTMSERDEKTLKATVYPTNATDNSVTWSSSPTGIVTVINGKVTAKAAGTTTITCKANDGSGVTATCSIKVTSSEATSKGNVKQVLAGDNYTMILKTDETLWAWGENGRGRLGLGDTWYKLTPVKVMDDVASMSANGGHTMIIKTDGTLWACGWNGHGELGDGTTTDRKTPVKVMDGVVSVSAGYMHTMILKTDDTLWACGDNEECQLGDGTYIENRTKPVSIMGGVASVSAGYMHTMILKSDGTLWACGRNGLGQLGFEIAGYRIKPQRVMEGVASVSAGHMHTMIIKADGTLWACGRNDYGQLGDGTTTDRRTPVKVMDGVASVSTSYMHTMILKTDGTLWACGWNCNGQLGDGTTTDRTTPVKVMDGVASVSAGSYHTMIIKTDGSLWACGNNKYGLLSDGTEIDRHSPVMIDWVTGISETEAEKYKDDKFYNLKGQKVSALKKDQIYVKNGKKFFVK